MPKLLDLIEKLLLILIMLATLVAVGAEIMHMVRYQKVELSDLLLHQSLCRQALYGQHQ